MMPKQGNRIDARLGTTVFDIPNLLVDRVNSVRLKINVLSQSPMAKKISAGMLFSGITMLLSSAAIAASTGGVVSPLVLPGLFFGALLAGAGGFACLLFGVNKLFPVDNIMNPDGRTSDRTFTPSR